MLPSSDLNSSRSLDWLKNWSYKGMKLDTASFFTDMFPAWHGSNMQIQIVFSFKIILQIIQQP